MAITPVDFIAPGMNAQQLAYGSAATPAAGFEGWMQKQIDGLNTALTQSDTLAAKLAAGETENLHQIMIGMEEAKLQFQLAIQVRNRLLEAYQDVSRMQV